MEGDDLIKLLFLGWPPKNGELIGWLVGWLVCWLISCTRKEGMKKLVPWIVAHTVIYE